MQCNAIEWNAQFRMYDFFWLHMDIEVQQEFQSSPIAADWPVYDAYSML